MEQVAKEFINDKTKNSITGTALNVSEIFKWFAEDFSKNGTVVDFLNKYASIKINEKVVLNYKDYNWSLNK
ncbi:MAG: hypothetical protein H7239_11505 [Flavobacterium sp.]|nr:hypothetical protein [Flavobacterium sp.]